MRRYKAIRKTALAICAALAFGSMFAGTCINTVASLPICGGLLAFCTPADQVNLLFPILDTPDYNTDASCTIPLGCGPGDIYTNIPPGFPGGDAPDQPADDQGGGLGTGGGGGGGGGG